ncbi:MAG: hypothetical protein K9G12_07205 [Candidatus Nanopelagicales bacterium]|nr:hypothetical protein [Candidatus Nanopelagicales bacterium]MCF8540053.1 hypothetical protein [Candidatus Nanopelagicales bacterium]
MDLTTSASVWMLAIALTLFLALTHVFAPSILDSQLLNKTPSRQDAVASFSGGVAVAYVFVHMLPELADGELAFSGIDIPDAIPDLFVQSALFLVALLGLVVFYAFDAKATESKEGSVTLYRTNLIMVGVLSLIFSYTNPDRIELGADFAILFAIVMSLHFILSDRGLARAHPNHFRREDRWVLSAFLFGGLALSYIAPPPNELFVAIPTAFLGGAVLMTVFREELPNVSVARLGWFTSGVALFSALLLWATYISAQHVG